MRRFKATRDFEAKEASLGGWSEGSTGGVRSSVA
jgi:hypothetical protein